MPEVGSVEDDSGGSGKGDRGVKGMAIQKVGKLMLNAVAKPTPFAAGYLSA